MGTSMLIAILLIAIATFAPSHGTVDGARGSPKPCHGAAIERVTCSNVIGQEKGLALCRAADDDFLKTLSSMVKDGLEMADNILSSMQRPLSVGLSLYNTLLSQISALITWFNFLVSFVTPGGAGAALLAWLRGDPASMSRGLPLDLHLPNHIPTLDLLDGSVDASR